MYSLDMKLVSSIPMLICFMFLTNCSNNSSDLKLIYNKVWQSEVELDVKKLNPALPTDIVNKVKITSKVTFREDGIMLSEGSCLGISPEGKTVVKEYLSSEGMATLSGNTITVNEDFVRSKKLQLNPGATGLKAQFLKCSAGLKKNNYKFKLNKEDSLDIEGTLFLRND